MIASWALCDADPARPTNHGSAQPRRHNYGGAGYRFLADPAKSAREGLPVFHMGGGSGYIWAAKFDDSGKGRLRITAVNPSLLPEHPVEPPRLPLSPILRPLFKRSPSGCHHPRTRRKLKETTPPALRKRSQPRMRNWKRSISSLKKHPKTASETVVYVYLISALKAAIKTSDPDAIEHEMTALVNALGSDKDYKKYQAEQGERAKEAGRP